MNCCNNSQGWKPLKSLSWSFPQSSECGNALALRQNWNRGQSCKRMYLMLPVLLNLWCRFLSPKTRSVVPGPWSFLGPRSQADPEENVSEAGDQSTDNGRRQTSLRSEQLSMGHPCDYITSLLSTGCLTYKMREESPSYSARLKWTWDGISITLGKILIPNKYLLNKWMKGYMFSSVAQSCLTPCNHMDCTRQASLSITNSRSLLKLLFSDAMQPSHPLSFLLLMPSVFPSISVFSKESVLCIRWTKYWSFSFSISPSIDYSRLIYFRIDQFDLLAAQGTLKSLLQHHSFLYSPAFFIVQLSHPYMATGKTIALTRQTFVGKVMSLLFNVLSRLVIAFLPRSKCLLISWLQSPFAVTLEPKKIKFVPVSIVSHPFAKKWWDQMPWS